MWTCFILQKNFIRLKYSYWWNDIYARREVKRLCLFLVCACSHMISKKHTKTWVSTTNYLFSSYADCCETKFLMSLGYVLFPFGLEVRPSMYKHCINGWAQVILVQSWNNQMKFFTYFISRRFKHSYRMPVFFFNPEFRVREYKHWYNGHAGVSFVLSWNTQTESLVCIIWGVFLRAPCVVSEKKDFSCQWERHYHVVLHLGAKWWKSEENVCLSNRFQQCYQRFTKPS